MSGLITVEDYNSTLLNYTGLFWYEIDCNKLWEIGLQSDEFYYDWIRVVKNGNNFKLYGIHGFPLWTGGMRTYGLNSSGGSYNPPYITLGVYGDREDKGKCYLEMGLNHFDSGEVTGHFYSMEGFLLNNNLFVKTPKTFQIEVPWALRYYPFKLHLKRLDDTIIELTNPTIEDGSRGRRLTFEYDGSELIQNTIKLIYNVGYPLDSICHFSINQFKSPNFLNITGNLYIGKSNNKLTIEPFISGVKCKLSYLDKEETILLGDTQQVNIDLSQKTDLKDITLKVELAEGPNSNKETLTYNLPVNYQTVNNMATFRNELSNINGGGILRLGSHFTANYDEPIPINHDVIIYGNNKNINLTHGRFIIKEGINVRIQDTNFLNGDTTFLQKDNSTLQLNNCSFTHCTANNNEGLGSVVCCDIDLESLTLPNDFTTVINDCSFTNCPGAIFHGGELTVNNSNYYLNDSSIMNVHAPYFLYQTDGSANITGSVFDVDMLENVYTCETFITSGNVTRYGTNAELIEVISACRGCLAPSNDEATINDITETNGLLEDIHFCEAEQNANLSQCLFLLGEDAMINNQISQDLQNPNNLNFTNNNRSHIFMKYYYPDIEGCVYISPETGFETKALCYGLSSTDYIYTHNVKITRTNWGTENIDNPLRRG